MLQILMPRFVIYSVIGLLLYSLGIPWVMLLAAVMFSTGYTVWGIKSGRFQRIKGKNISLQKDERVDLISARAARNGFVVMQLISGCGVFYFGFIKGLESIPVSTLGLTLLFGWISFVVSDSLQQRN